MTNEPNKLLDVATKAAIRAGRVIKQYWGDLESSEVEQKSSWRDLVTIADKKAEELVIKTIKHRFPEHIIISEEGGGKSTEDNDSEYKWAIDPLDGTTNFRHSYPFFCTSIGVLKNNQPVAGVVYDPIHDELFTATQGQGAFLNGRRIHVSTVNALKESLLVTGFAYSVNDLQQQSMELFKKLSFHTHGVRRDGAAALDLCFVAAGRLEAFWEYGLNIWDVAAGALIVQEAGGKIANPLGKPLDLFNGQILASNELIFSELQSEIQNSVASLTKN
ncbi:MAG: inositol monophosphatase family protein [Candidatus Caenarcaniphilales bacterium]|nr:inositol monophosphatase family protein [Candidatus Caenarcaniphilales bacterium]